MAETNPTDATVTVTRTMTPGEVAAVEHAAELAAASLEASRSATTGKIVRPTSQLIERRGLVGPPVELVPLDEPLKPGWRTSEWYLKLVALALSAAFANGLITNSTALAIAGIAASVLTAAGYTVCRTVLKAAVVRSAAP